MSAMNGSDSQKANSGASVEIRRYLPGDEGAISTLLRRTLMEVNANYCPAVEMDWLYNRYTPETVVQIASEGHMYSMLENGVIVGTGTVMITGEKECEIIAAFLLPEAIGRGLGAKLFRVLEDDCRSTGAAKVWLTSSVNALDFYEKHDYVNPVGYRMRSPEDNLLHMEKML